MCYCEAALPGFGFDLTLRVICESKSDEIYGVIIHQTLFIFPYSRTVSRLQAVIFAPNFPLVQFETKRSIQHAGFQSVLRPRV